MPGDDRHRRRPVIRREREQKVALMDAPKEGERAGGAARGEN